jgi:LPPG:FO 2-phospho-L-lactate transferase
VALKDTGRIVVLVGGVGGAKLAHGLAQILAPGQLTIIVNTGDDFWHYGLRVCPDMDTVMYTLSGLVDKTNGWGVAGDTRAMLGALRRYGEDTWFGLGDQDIATHLLRTQALQRGERLTLIMRRLTSALSIPHPILPMTDAPVATRVDTVEYGELEFQEYFVRYRWQPTMKGIRFDGVDAASLSPEVSEALAQADAILFGPSNPWLSIAPILAVPGMREALTARNVPRVAVTPIVDGQAIKGPAAKLMAELGYQVSPHTVADYYGNVINGFVYDKRDAALDLKGVRATTLDTVMQTEQDRARLALEVLNWLESW